MYTFYLWRTNLMYFTSMPDISGLCTFESDLLFYLILFFYTSCEVCTVTMAPRQLWTLIRVSTTMPCWKPYRIILFILSAWPYFFRTTCFLGQLLAIMKDKRMEKNSFFYKFRTVGGHRLWMQLEKLSVSLRQSSETRDFIIISVPS